jgi:3-isopropylmalate/(R)-2-methylmalate dehydratase small subunit
MEKILRGKVWRFEGVLDVDREICPVEHLDIFKGENKSAEELSRELGCYCLTEVDPEFPKKIQPGDFIVGSEGFGYGHDHDHACMSLRGAGVAAVLCEVSNINFKRNSIHHGLPVIDIRGIMAGTKTGDELEIDLVGGTVLNLTAGKKFSFIPYPDFILEILWAGGLYPQLVQEVKRGLYG